MRERILATKFVNYDWAEWDGVNRSDFEPVGDLVLILVDRVSEKLSENIIAADSTRETHDHAVKSGIIVALGWDAFTWNADRTRPFGQAKPVVGERVLFKRYAGEAVLGADRKDYRMMSDNSIIAVIKDTAAGAPPPAQEATETTESTATQVAGESINIQAMELEDVE